MKKLHTRIFFPVVIVLLVFPLLTLLSFSLVSDSYFENMAGRNTTQMARQVQKIIKQTPDKLIRGLQGLPRENAAKTSVLVFNRNRELRYPSELPQIPGIPELISKVEVMLEESDYPEKELIRLDLEEGSYMLEILNASSKGGPSRSAVCYSAIPNTGALMESVWKLLLMITGFCLLISTVLIWFIAKSIACPIGKLCQKARAVGKGDYAPISETFKIRELEDLKHSINQMEEDLKASEDMTVSFFQNASHDLKTPLASISGYAQAIQCGLTADTKQAAGVILSESKRMAALVDSILTISKLDNQTLKLKPVEIDLNEFLEEQAQILQGSTDKRILVEDCSEELHAQADPQLLIRILQNLISNALRYAEREVRLSLRKEAEAAVIEVEDDGPGIPESDLVNIFERFSKGEGGGFGLGLSIVKSGVDYMGGSVFAENRKPPLHGARFTVALPLQESEGKKND